jgi:redox-sensitive bicupin YhaK (pirin superfamily)
MLTLRPARERGTTDFGWLDSRHTFSFGEYFDTSHMGFRSLRVINDDRVAPGAGFPTHPHRDMEIVTYVLEGAIEHKDSMGNGSVITAGEVQRMSAGTGVTHSEFNHSKKDALHFLQIWLLPEKRGLAPGYEQKRFDRADLEGKLRLVVSHDGHEGSLRMNQDAAIRAGVLAKGARLEHAIPEGRHAWVHVARGEVRLDGKTLGEGDGAALSGVSKLALEGGAGGAEVLVFDLG